MADETIHTRTFQVTVSFTDEQRDKIMGSIDYWARGDSTISEAIRSEILSNLESVGLDASVTIVERMEVG